MSEQLRLGELKHIPIPPDAGKVAGWKEVPIVENGEPLVPLGPFSDNDAIFPDSIYSGERVDSPYFKNPPEGSLTTMFVRQSVVEQLQKAEASLPYGMHLVVFDSFRTLAVQGSLFDLYYSQLKGQNPSMSDEQLMSETQKYVSFPSTDPTRPSTHNTGGSVDLAIFELPQEIEEQVRKIGQRIKDAGDNWQDAYGLEMRRITLIARNAKLLNFGTPFDWGGEEAALDYLERKAKEKVIYPARQEARRNRRLLYHVMREAGFEAYPDEWWHYNSPKSQMGAKTAGLPNAEFGPATLSAENLAHERMRAHHRLGTIRIFEGARPAGKFGPSEYFAVVLNSVAENGDIRLTSLPEAEVIAPKR